jgi:CubicO group peptidase (beta-lactamase class C family)
VLSAQALTIAIERLHAAVEAGGPLGFQFYTSQDADPVCNVAVGHYRLGEEITTGHRLPWICSGKPVTVIALAQMYERGRLSTATRVAEVVPEFGRHGKQDVTIEHLLTHTVLFDGDELWDTPDRATALATICDWPLLAPPGQRACYSGFAGWLVLAEVVQRVSGVDFYDYVRHQVLDPLEMHSATFWHEPGDRAPRDVMFERAADGSLEQGGWIGGPGVVRWPGTGLWGTASDLARPFECVIGGGVWRGTRLMAPETVEHFFTPVRTGIPDELFSGLELSWSRGTCTDPAWFGAPKEASVTGHTGHRTSLVVGDFGRGTVVACVSNTALSSARVLRRLDNLLVRDVYEGLRAGSSAAAPAEQPTGGGR